MLAMSEGWKIDHNESGELVATHQHDRGEPVVATMQKGADGINQAVCECGASFPIDRDHGDRASV